MILLFNPRSARWKHRLPLSLLSLGAVLEGKYDYEIVDGNFEKNPAETLIRTIREKSIRYLGVTVMPGPQLVEAITVTQQVKSQFPNLVVIWGGYFPSLHAETVLKAGFVDHVIRGPGEYAFFELINKLEGMGETGKMGSDPSHETVRIDVGAVLRSERGQTPFSPSPPLPYHRMDVNRYIGKTCLGTRTIAYHSSFGCPFLCGFCAVAAIYKGRWSGKPAAAVAEDVLWFRKEHGVNAVEFVDNNFFVAEHRTREIAERLKGSGITWWGEARPDTLMEFTDSTWRTMRDGGCQMIFFGAESSSADVLARMDKGGTQTPDTVLQLAERMKQFGIVPEFSFVLGTPSSDVDAQIERDIQYIRRIKSINPRSEIVIYIYSPVAFDDAELLQQARTFGFDFPKQLVDWLDPIWQTFDLRKNPHTPWLAPRHVERIMNFERVLNARFPTISDIKLKRWQTAILKTLGAWRYKAGFYAAPWEIRLVANRLFRYRQPEIEGF
jgi:radical SAM superfamily enzyme YgiQ (UPF0313 family)